MLVLVPAPSLKGLQTVVSNDSLFPKNYRKSKESLSLDKTEAGEEILSKADEMKTIETVKILIAMLYTIKNHLRAEWGVALSPGTSLTEDGQDTSTVGSSTFKFQSLILKQSLNSAPRLSQSP